MQTIDNSTSGSKKIRNPRTSEFFKRLSPALMEDWNAMEFPHSYGPNVVLFAEKESSRGIFVVLEGEVRLSINSNDGKRLSLRIARKGDILGLSSALTGNNYEMTAETLYPAKIGHVGRAEFLNFLARHPQVYPNVTEELSRQMMMACDQLRTVGLSQSAPEKLARLLLEWSETDQSNETGGRVRFSLTHEEIGEFIGASRETVTRTLSNFKHRQLVSFRGSMLEIPSRTALASYANS
ncbi:Crp/Fnr family transcriptional regulator [Acidobacteria bacterium AB60]|nr:Crp/Fnr family transcriptional regulator [Acidobacteria bacterium AB60]